MQDAQWNDPAYQAARQQALEAAEQRAKLHEQAARQMAGVHGEPKNRAERRRLARVRQKGHA